MGPIIVSNYNYRVFFSCFNFGGFGCFGYLQLSSSYLLVGMPVTLHLGSELLNIPEGHKLSDIEPNGGNPWDGKRAPGVRNTFVVFFLFFHLARRFWNHTCHKNYHVISWKKQIHESTSEIEAIVIKFHLIMEYIIQISTRILLANISV